MDRPVRVAFDIGGVLSKYPTILRAMAQALHDGGAEVFVITDMRTPDRVLELLEANGFGFINPANIMCADFETYGEGCKAVAARAALHRRLPGRLPGLRDQGLPCPPPGAARPRDAVLRRLLADRWRRGRVRPAAESATFH